MYSAPQVYCELRPLTNSLMCKFEQIDAKKTKELFLRFNNKDLQAIPTSALSVNGCEQEWEESATILFLLSLLEFMICRKH